MISLMKSSQNIAHQKLGNHLLEHLLPAKMEFQRVASEKIKTNLGEIVLLLYLGSLLLFLALLVDILRLLRLKVECQKNVLKTVLTNIQSINRVMKSATSHH